MVINNLYEHTQLIDDFLHIHTVHMSPKTDYKIINEMIKRFQCDFKQHCNANKRHRRRGLLSNPSTCDRIHSYFIHHIAKGDDDDDDEEKKEKNENNEKKEKEEEIEEEEKKEIYIESNNDDKEWINEIFKQKIDISKEQKVYECLINGMNVFRWQGAHGFKNHRGLSHCMLYII